MTFIPPDPILDGREEALVAELTDRYKKLTSPGYVAKAVSKARKGLLAVTPGRVRRLAQAAVDVAAEREVVKRVLEHAGRGFAELSAQASRFTYSHDGILSALRADGTHIPRFEEVCAARSYRLERVARRRDYADLLAALAEGAATGAPRLPGVPFNIALSFFLYFRAVQGIALYYGYDVKGDPSELEFASATTITCFNPQVEGGTESLSGVIGKMMLAANLSALRHALATHRCGRSLCPG